jgi:hypothetical protein
MRTPPRSLWHNGNIVVPTGDGTFANVYMMGSGSGLGATDYYSTLPEALRNVVMLRRAVGPNIMYGQE